MGRGLEEIYGEVIIKKYFPRKDEILKQRLICVGLGYEEADIMAVDNALNLARLAVQDGVLMALHGYRDLDSENLNNRIDILNPKFKGFEALGRAVTDDEEVVGAGVLFAQNDNLELRAKLGLKVMEQAAEMTVAINEVRSAAGLGGVKMAINLSQALINDDDCVRKILAILHERRLGADHLVVEVLETVNLDQNGIEVVRGLQEAGALISVDDLNDDASMENLIKLIKAEILVNEVKFDGNFSRNINASKLKQMSALASYAGATTLVWEGHPKGVDLAKIRKAMAENSWNCEVLFEGIAKSFED